MATGDKLVNLDDLKEVYTKVDGDVGELKSALNSMSTATDSDEGKALKAKTVSGGKVTEWEFGSAGGIAEEIKQALLDCFQRVAWIDSDGQDYYDALEEALYPPVALDRITAVYTQSGTVYEGSSLDALKSDLVVTAYYSDSTSSVVSNYILSGTLAEGTSTITATYGGKTATFTVAVTAVPVVASISAVFDSSAVVYDWDSLDSLKSSLVVTALYSDQSSEVVPSANYSLSGTLTAGASTITVTYSGETTTFTVSVHGFTYLTGYSMSVNTAPIGLNANTDRAVFVDTYGEYPIKYKATGEDSPYYAMPIPMGATKLLATNNTRNKVPVIFKYDNQGMLVMQYSYGWLPNTSYDITEYNDGTYLITLGIQTNTGSGDVEVSFSFD